MKANEEWILTITTPERANGEFGLTVKNTEKYWMVISTFRENKNTKAIEFVDPLDANWAEEAWFEVEIPPCPF